MLLNRETPVIILFLSISMIHWPFIFEHSDISNRYTRYLLVILILLLIVSKIRTFKFDEILIFGIIFFTALLQSFANSLTFENLVYFYSKILFIFLFWVYIKQKSIIDLPYLKYWKIFSSIIFIFSILTFILHSFTNIQTDYFGIDHALHNLPHGISLEIFYAKKIIKTGKRVLSADDKEHVTLEMYKNITIPNLLIKTLKIKKDLSNINYSVDEKKDLLKVRKLFKKVKNPIKISLKELLKRII